jgi:hypothetical protein
MSKAVATELGVGDKVRVHFHPPGPMSSFCEGVVRRVDVAAPEGRFFVVEVMNEVILDREHRIKPGFEEYVRYECRNDFPGRIEIHSPAEPSEREDHEPKPAIGLRLVEAPDDLAQNPEAKHGQFLTQLERQEDCRKGFIAALFRRQR